MSIRTLTLLVLLFFLIMGFKPFKSRTYHSSTHYGTHSSAQYGNRNPYVNLVEVILDYIFPHTPIYTHPTNPNLDNPNSTNPNPTYRQVY